MQNLKDKNADQKDSPTALGMEEMNSMIKSFQDLLSILKSYIREMKKYL